MSFTYKPDGATLRRFMLDQGFFRGLRGPVGSGKSVACCMEVFRRASAQAPDRNRVRRSRWAIIRNTNPQLKTTTIKTWLDWFPESEFGKFAWSPPYTHMVRCEVGDGTTMEMEVIFLALDQPDDVKKLLSLELTGVWINEAREISKEIVDACTMRVGRFPSMREGGPSWYGVIADTNAPDEDHWWPVMAGEAPIPEFITREEALMMVKPANWNFFNQPGGMVPTYANDNGPDGSKEITGYALNNLLENGKNLTPEYYPQIIAGKSTQWINVYVLNKLGALTDGKPVYQTFRREVHVAAESMEPVLTQLVYVGMDFGLTPAAVAAQKINGRWRVLRELVATDMGAKRFAILYGQWLVREFAGCKILGFGDPSGDNRAQSDETTPFQMLRAAGHQLRPASTNDPVLRIEAGAAPLDRMIDGQSGLLVDPSCTMLIRGFEGGYHYRRMQVSGEARYDTYPNKNRFSHVHDAYQYLMIGGGEGRALTTMAEGGPKNRVAKTGRNVFDRNKQRPRRAI